MTNTNNGFDLQNESATIFMCTRQKYHFLSLKFLYPLSMYPAIDKYYRGSGETMHASYIGLPIAMDMQWERGGEFC